MSSRKTVERRPVLGPDPPPQCKKSYTFFFFQKTKKVYTLGWSKIGLCYTFQKYGLKWLNIAL